MLMENVDYVAKAKILMKRTALTAALVVMPLVAVSSVARAAAVLPTNGFGCLPSGSGTPTPCPSGAGASQLPEAANGIAGVKLYTIGTVSYFASGGVSSLTLLASGFLSGQIDIGTVIPLAYDFS